ncbi:ferritin-like domain-containing protein [Serratia sp. AKBS12]|uniref:ferritin-like domain-containing protein n=1 Tax=Serratia sp. AKBS12 TaxID=2974597 RepID=UPI002165648A|nr:ferritin-like domain-containing protein [Serratia sp. AKBS12]MCS3408101.1 ferritin-like domain-containing protein [Serratia sp. AKBS12]HEI8866227.1 ferritin-like domain-containing protein [Serratia odorifera]
MSDLKDHFIDWLRDAHAMEEQAETMLNGMKDRVKDYPQLHNRVIQHLEETRQQQQQLKSCIERLDTSTSSMKDLAGKAVALGQTLSGFFVEDEIVKGSMSSYVFEHMEIASYTTLIAAAELVGDYETQLVLEKILKQEQAMADWLLENMPSITKAYLNQK